MFCTPWLIPGPQTDHRLDPLPGCSRRSRSGRNRVCCYYPSVTMPFRRSRTAHPGSDPGGAPGLRQIRCNASYHERTPGWKMSRSSQFLHRVWSRVRPLRWVILLAAALFLFRVGYVRNHVTVHTDEIHYTEDGLWAKSDVALSDLWGHFVYRHVHPHPFLDPRTDRMFLHGDPQANFVGDLASYRRAGHPPVYMILLAVAYAPWTRGQLLDGQRPVDIARTVNTLFDVTWLILLFDILRRRTGGPGGLGALWAVGPDALRLGLRHNGLSGCPRHVDGGPRGLDAVGHHPTQGLVYFLGAVGYRSGPGSCHQAIEYRGLSVARGSLSPVPTALATSRDAAGKRHGRSPCQSSPSRPSATHWPCSPKSAHARIPTSTWS